MKTLCSVLLLLRNMCQLPADVGAAGLNQDSGILRAEVGQNVTLRCSCHNDNVTFFSWYQQSLGGKPNVIAKRMTGSPEANISPAFKERFHVSPQSERGLNHLHIGDVRLSDSARYYCGILEFNAIDFGVGVFLHVKTSWSETRAVVRQPLTAAAPRRPGLPVSLNCTAYTEHPAADRTLFWLRYVGSQPTILRPGGEQCAQKTCTSTLTIESASSPDPGTYYCALASGGELVFGNGTRLEVGEGPTKPFQPVQWWLSAALAVSVAVLLALMAAMFRLRKGPCSRCRGSVARASDASEIFSPRKSRDAVAVLYAPLSLNGSRPRRLRRDGDEDPVCVYSRVKSRTSEAGPQAQPVE